MSSVMQVVQDIRDNISSPYWSARKNKQHDKFIFEVLNCKNKRIGVFNNGNDALVAASAPAVLDRWAYMLEAFEDLSRLIFSKQNNSVMSLQNEDVKKVWSESAKYYRDFLRLFEQCMNLSVDEILTSREARFDEYDKI